MITLPFNTQDPPPQDPRHRAGYEAERQLSFYLHRAFAMNPEVHVLNGLRLVDKDQPEQMGESGVAQIDHLVLHRFGAFVVESKSVCETITVQSDGTGGDMWSRTFKSKAEGMPSPLRQAERQAKALRAFLQPHRAKILDRVPVGMRTLSKLVHGTDQRGFLNLPMQIIAAISDNGRLRHSDHWRPPSEPFQTFVCKADNVAAKIEEEIARHRESARLSTPLDGKYGLWRMKAEEVEAVAEFLVGNHTPRVCSASMRSERTAPQTSPRSAAQAKSVRSEPTSAASASAGDLDGRPRLGGSAANPVAPIVERAGVGGVAFACKRCAGTNLAVRWGHSYYFKCFGCDGNTPIPAICTVCDAQGDRGKVVKIRKEGLKFFRCCEACGIEEGIWTNPDEG